MKFSIFFFHPTSTMFGIAVHPLLAMVLLPYILAFGPFCIAPIIFQIMQLTLRFVSFVPLHFFACAFWFHRTRPGLRTGWGCGGSPRCRGYFLNPGIFPTRRIARSPTFPYLVLPVPSLCYPTGIACVFGSVFGFLQRPPSFAGGRDRFWAPT